MITLFVFWQSTPFYFVVLTSSQVIGTPSLRNTIVSMRYATVEPLGCRYEDDSELSPYPVTGADLGFSLGRGFGGSEVDISKISHVKIKFWSSQQGGCNPHSNSSILKQLSQNIAVKGFKQFVLPSFTLSHDQSYSNHFLNVESLEMYGNHGYINNDSLNWQLFMFTL